MVCKPVLALIVGHTPKAGGAVSVGGVSEFDFNDALARDIARRVTGAEVRLVYRGLPNDYAGLPAKVNATRADFAVSLHFNSAADARASGTEVLFAQVSSRSRVLAAMVHSHLLHALKLPDRGIKARAKQDRGSTLLYKTAMPCVIAEPFFGSSFTDWGRAISMREELVQAYVRAIEDYATTFG